MPAPYQDPYEAQGTPHFRLPSLTRMVKLLLIANAAVFVLQWLTLMIGGSDADNRFVELFGSNPAYWKSWFPFVPVWQLLTSGFMHSTASLMHIFWNMLLLFFFGTMLEEIVGGRRFLTTYLIALLVASVFHLASEFATLLINGSALTPALGASGGVLAVLVACAVMRPNTPVIVLFIPVKLKWLAIALVVMDVFMASVTTKTGASSGTGHFAHIGGAVYGFLAARQGWIWKDPVEAGQKRREVRHRERAQADDQRMDELLAKIHREGMGSLDRREREFLKRMSKRS